MGNSLNIKRITAQFIETLNGTKELEGNHLIFHYLEMS